MREPKSHDSINAHADIASRNQMRGSNISHILEIEPEGQNRKTTHDIDRETSTRNEIPYHIFPPDPDGEIFGNMEKNKIEKMRRKDQ